MENVFCKVHIDLFDSMPGFLKKLKQFIGHFRIEQQSVTESYDGIVTISFYTDKVQIKEGETRQVDIIAKTEPDGSWNFTEITR